MTCDGFCELWVGSELTFCGEQWTTMQPSSRGSEEAISNPQEQTEVSITRTTTVLPFVYTILSLCALSLVASPRVVVGLHGYRLTFL